MPPPFPIPEKQRPSGFGSSEIEVVIHVDAALASVGRALAGADFTLRPSGWRAGRRLGGQTKELAMAAVAAVNEAIELPALIHDMSIRTITRARET